MYTPSALNRQIFLQAKTAVEGETEGLAAAVGQRLRAALQSSQSQPVVCSACRSAGLRDSQSYWVLE